jgi:hypothetical protein
MNQKELNKVKAILPLSKTVVALNQGKTLMEVFAEERAGPLVPSKPGDPEAAIKVDMSPSTDEQKLNKTERAYLALLRRQGHQWVGVQNVTLKLGDDCRYTPDFTVINAEGKLLALEVKGFFRDDAKVKVKVAARLYPFIKFYVVRKEKDRFAHELVKP